MRLTELLDFLRRKMEEEMAGWGQTVDTFKTRTHFNCKAFHVTTRQNNPCTAWSPEHHFC